MPARDGTGPLGQGPMTGGGRGFCSGANEPAGRCGHGRGYRNRFHATGLPLWAREPGVDPRLSRIEERLNRLESE